MKIQNPVTVQQQKLAAMKTDVNPYTSQDYYKNRHKVFDVSGYREAIYKKHNYKCAACREILNDMEEKVELHHIIPKKDGGTYSMDNIVPLHKTCHA
jgi:5-methylcytosine-specific restriction endonuclease McrA